MHNLPTNPYKCYDEARDSNIKSHWITVRSRQIAKRKMFFRLQQDIVRKHFFLRQEKAKAVEGKKTFTSLIVLLNFLSLVSINT